MDVVVVLFKGGIVCCVFDFHSICYYMLLHYKSIWSH